MPIELTDDQWASVQQASEAPVRVSDPAHTSAFVLLPESLYERLRPLIADVPVSEQERLFHLQEFGRRAGWDDPEMDIYDDLDPRRRP